MSEQEFRADGWPLCPRCGEDELWSHTGMEPPYAPNIPLETYFESEFRCYRCNWSGRIANRYLHRTPSLPSTEGQS